MKEIELIAKAQDWMMTQGVDFTMNVVAFLVILFVGFFAIKILLRLVRGLLKKSKRVNDTLRRFVLNVTGKVLWVLLLMVALPRLGVDIAPLVAGLGVTGFIVGFAFQESLGNLAAGLMLILNQPFKAGDFIEAGGHMGTVEEINMMATTMNSPDNKKIVVPNRNIWGSSIVNFTAHDTRRVDMTVGIGYGEDIGKARALIEGILKADERVLKDPAPVIEVIEMADSSVNFAVRPWVKTTEYWNVFFHVQRTVKETFDREGVEIPFPQVDVHHYGSSPSGEGQNT